MQTHKDSFDLLFWVSHNSVPPKPLSGNKENVGVDFYAWAWNHRAEQQVEVGDSDSHLRVAVVWWWWWRRRMQASDEILAQPERAQAWKAKRQNYSELKDKVRECLARRKQADGSLDKNSDEETIIEVILTAPENQSDKENWAEMKQGRSFLMEHGHTLHL